MASRLGTVASGSLLENRAPDHMLRPPRPAMTQLSIFAETMLPKRVWPTYYYYYFLPKTCQHSPEKTVETCCEQGA